MKAGTFAELKAIISSVCLYIMSIDVEFAMSVVAFIIILVSNFKRFVWQINDWCKRLRK